METYEQIRNPITNRPIHLYGATFNRLIEDGLYTKEYLLSLKRIEIIRHYTNPVVPHKYSTIYNSYSMNSFTKINDTDLYIFSWLDDKSLVRLSQVDHRLYSLCRNNVYLSKRINDYMKPFISKHNDMVCKIAQAIYSENSRKGSTLQYIKKYLETNYNIKETKFIKKTINKLIKSEAAEGLIVNKYHRGHYRLSREFREKLRINRLN